MTRLVYAPADGLAPYTAGLCNPEAGITYPAGDGAEHFYHRIEVAVYT